MWRWWWGRDGSVITLWDVLKITWDNNIALYQLELLSNIYYFTIYLIYRIKSHKGAFRGLMLCYVCILETYSFCFTSCSFLYKHVGLPDVVSLPFVSDIVLLVIIGHMFSVSVDQVLIFLSQYNLTFSNVLCISLFD